MFGSVSISHHLMNILMGFCVRDVARRMEPNSLIDKCVLGAKYVP